MTSLMNSVDQRTNIVGQNRLELLMFRLHGPQPYGINVFKVREVIRCPELSELPGANPHVRGIAHLRGVPVTVIDLSQATGGKPISDLSNAFILVTEYNRHVQAFLVGNVERIVNVNWSEMLPPPAGVGRSHYMTAVTRIDGRMVQVIDVEKVFSEISPMHEEISESIKQAAQQFESVFMGMLLSSMRKANESFGEDNPLNSQATEFYRDMHDSQLATELSKKGALGLADLMVQQLSPALSGRPASLSAAMSSGIKVLWPAARLLAPIASTSCSSASAQASSGVWNSGPEVTSKPMSVKAEAITLAPRSWPSWPILATSRRGLRPSRRVTASTPSITWA